MWLKVKFPASNAIKKHLNNKNTFDLYQGMKMFDSVSPYCPQQYLKAPLHSPKIF